MAYSETTRALYNRDALRYPSDTTAGEWHFLAPFMPPRSRVGRPRKTDLRDVIDAIFYILVSGCQWRMLPKDFPPRSTVQRYFYDWRNSGLWKKINRRLVKLERRRQGRRATPTTGIIDSQSAKTTETPGPRGFDMAKRVKGRKRHIVTDTTGLLLALRVHEANVQDCHGAVPLLRDLRRTVPRVRHIFADRVYRGEQLLNAIKDCGRWTVEIITRIEKTGSFVPERKRWVVERTFAWLSRNRRLAKDFEASITSQEAWTWIAQIKLLSRRIARFAQ